MSDLQCSARIVLLRHGEATHEVGTAARGSAAGLTERGRHQARTAARRLVAERVSHVYAGRLRPAVQTAGVLADRLGVATTTRELDSRLGEVLEEVADLHRGETVVVVSPGEEVRATLETWGWPGAAAALLPGAAVVLERDGDGWRHAGRW